MTVLNLCILTFKVSLVSEVKPKIASIYSSGRAMISRILLRMSGLAWKDTRIPADQKIWNEQKPHFEDIALGSLPILKINDEVFYQQFSIKQWAAAKA